MHRELQDVGHKGHVHDTAANAQNTGQKAYKNAAQHAQLPFIMLWHLRIGTAGAIFLRSFSEHVIGHTREEKAENSVK
jgi:hypothetical protein